MAFRSLLIAAMAAVRACGSAPGMTASPFANLSTLPVRIDPESVTALAFMNLTECSHGEFDSSLQECRCFEGWTTAGITHPWQYMEGICEQYQCESDAKCEEVLGIPGASCPIRGWNCYCGWEWAFSNFGHGWETPHKKGGGQCMGVSYTFSIFTGHVVEAIMAKLWIIFPPLALLLLPFGRKRAICDHHRPSLWNSIRKLCGTPSRCRGECVASNTYTLDTFKDDFAWSLFVLDIGMWSYVFLATVWFVTLFTWSMVLWAFVLVVLACWTAMACIATTCSAIGSVCGLQMINGQPACDCNCTPSDRCCEGCAEGCCSDCVECCCRAPVARPSSPAEMIANELLWGGSYPYDPIWGYSGYGQAPVNVQTISGDLDCVCNCCDACLRCTGECCPTQNCRCPCRTPPCITMPLATVLYVIPTMPENAWGGLFGFLMGTHQFSPQCWLYAGGNPFVEFMGMSWRRRGDLHQDWAWRERVYEFLVGGAGRAAEEGGAAGRSSDSSDSSDRTPQRAIRIGGARVISVSRPFSQRKDGCAQSSFEDYQMNECWICRQGCDEWDQWLSCHHLFCRGCSSEMLRRRMPCPLCRVASSTVLRGHAYSQGDTDSECESNLTPKMLLGSTPSRMNSKIGVGEGL